MFSLDCPSAGGPDPAGYGDLGERGRGVLPAAAGAILQPRHAVRQRGLFLHRHRGRAGAAGAPGLLRGPQREQVSAAHGRCIGPTLRHSCTGADAHRKCRVVLLHRCAEGSTKALRFYNSTIQQLIYPKRRTFEA